MIRAANYLSVTVTDRIDQPALRSVQVGSCVAAAWPGEGWGRRCAVKQRAGRKSQWLLTFPSVEGEASYCAP